jgi:surface-anchored protein
MLNTRYFVGLTFCLGALCFVNSDTTAQSVYSTGHGDIGVAYEGGALELHWHIEGGTVDGVVRPDEEFEADELVAVTGFAFNEPDGRPTGGAWDPIGNNAGDKTWYFSSSGLDSDNNNTPFIGLASAELDPNDWSTLLTWAVTDVSGPGQFSVWQNGVTPTFFASSADGLDANDEFTAAIGGHDHFNYGFTELGDYDVTFQVRATHSTDGDRTDEKTFSFSVVAVPEPGSFAVIASLGIAGLFIRRRQVA